MGVVITIVVWTWILGFMVFWAYEKSKRAGQLASIIAILVWIWIVFF